MGSVVGEVSKRPDDSPKTLNFFQIDLKNNSRKNIL